MQRMRRGANHVAAPQLPPDQYVLGLIKEAPPHNFRREQVVQSDAVTL
jgi:hypothetical protein